MTMDAPDHSADAVRYVLTAANQGQHNYRGGIKTGAHPLMWVSEERGSVNASRRRAHITSIETL